MTPDERAARLHLTAAAESLRVASERLCDWLEATVGDDATAPIQHCGTEPALSPAPVSSSPPPIPLGAVVEVEGDGYSPYTRVHGGWWDCDGDSWRDDHARHGTRAALITAIYHARREAEEARENAGERFRDIEGYVNLQARAMASIDAQKDAAIRERDEAWAQARAVQQMLDEARRALAAKQDQGLGASAPNSEGQGPMIPTDGPPSPAPASAPCGHTNTSPSPDSPHARVAAPRRWWLVVGPDGVAVATMEREEDARAYADTRNFVRSNPAYCSVVPVVEARVTRETVERVEGIVRKARGTNRTSEHWAYEIVRALGLTVEE